jgi:glucose-6-phosphate isomerase
MITINFSSLFKISPSHGVSQSEFLIDKKLLPSFLEKISQREQGFHSDEVLKNEGLITEIETFDKGVKGKFEYIVLLGIGGSSLGPLAIKEAFGNLIKGTKPQLFVLDNIDPDYISETLDAINLSKTLFLVITKSGGTPETLSQYFFFQKKIQEAGLLEQEHFVFITDPEKGFLRKEAQKKHITAFPIPHNVGGRFSVLTSVGLVTAALLGLDVRSFLNGALEMREQFLSETLEKNLPFQLALVQFLLFQKGKNIHVMYSYSQKLYRTADWFRQLLAESTGKKNNTQGEDVFTGLTPIKALGVTDQHSQNQLYMEGPNDKLFIFLEVEKFSSHDLPIPSPDLEEFSYLKNATFGKLLSMEKLGTEEAFTKNNRPSISIVFPEISEENLGAFFFLFEGATAFLGEFLNINAFDQPGVELSKELAREYLLKK